MAVSPTDVMDKLASLAKRRGFIFQSSEIYGGFGGFWDYGPLGCELMANVRAFWWRSMVRERRDIVGLDSSIISNPEVWVASGHVGHFNDILVDDKNTKERFRIDQLEYKSDEDAKKAEELAKGRIVGEQTGSYWDELNNLIGYFPKNPNTHKDSRFTEPSQFNLMLATNIGAKSDKSSTAYLRAETCQPIFVDFDQIRVSARQKVPFGVAQVGKAFRNEINPRNFTFRSREFSQMEMEFFIPPDALVDKSKFPDDRTEMEWFEYWKEERRKYYERLGLWKPDLMRLRDHRPDELAHYAKAACDFEFAFPFGWAELEGVHHRGDYDLRQHQSHSGKKLEYFDDERKANYLPVCIETSVGLDRTVLALLCAAYDEDTAETKKEGKDEDVRVVLRLPACVAPVQVGVLPLSKKLNEYADKLERDLSKHFATEFDVTGSIGKRYRRQDEIGTPYCVTVDFQTLEGGDAADLRAKGTIGEGTYDFEGDLKDTVTIRDRDTLRQSRVHVDSLAAWLKDKLG
ncbi:MAG: glycine--tRNA ligase [bacterium]|jgi:glycyl-tRNA synthetase